MPHACNKVVSSTAAAAVWTYAVDLHLPCAGGGSFQLSNSSSCGAFSRLPAGCSAAPAGAVAQPRHHGLSTWPHGPARQWQQVAGSQVPQSCQGGAPAAADAGGSAAGRGASAGGGCGSSWQAAVGDAAAATSNCSSRNSRSGRACADRGLWGISWQLGSSFSSGSQQQQWQQCGVGWRCRSGAQQCTFMCCSSGQQLSGGSSRPQPGPAAASLHSFPGWHSN